MMNQIAVKAAIEAADWLALRTDEVEKFGNNKDVVSHRHAWEEVKKAHESSIDSETADDGDNYLTKAEIFEKYQSITGQDLTQRPKPEIKLTKVSTPRERLLRIKILTKYRGKYGFNAKMAEPTMTDLLREDMIKNDPASLRQPGVLNQKWDTLSDGEQNKLNKRLVAAVATYRKKNIDPINRAIKDRNWLALKRSEVLQFGHEQDIFLYDEEWANAMYPDGELASVSLYEDESTETTEPKELKRTRPRKVLTKEDIKQRLLKRHKNKYLFKEDSLDENKTEILKAISAKDWLALKDTEVTQFGAPRDYLDHKHAWKRALK